MILLKAFCVRRMGNKSYYLLAYIVFDDRVVPKLFSLFGERLFCSTGLFMTWTSPCSVCSRNIPIPSRRRRRRGRRKNEEGRKKKKEKEEEELLWQLMLRSRTSLLCRHPLIRKSFCLFRIYFCFHFCIFVFTFELFWLPKQNAKKAVQVDK